MQVHCDASQTHCAECCVTFLVRALLLNTNRLYSSRQSAKLDALAAQRCVHVVQLQGNVFFGNVQQVVDCVKEELAVSSAPATTISSTGNSSATANAAVSSAAVSSEKMYLVLDCTFVSTLDSTAMAALVSASTLYTQLHDTAVTLRKRAQFSVAIHELAGL
jgi:ABC-type transporter Mla MlaB component